MKLKEIAIVDDDNDNNNKKKEEDWSKGSKYC